MKLFKTLFFAFALAGLGTGAAYAHDFTAVHNGKTIYYIITSSSAPLTAAVSFRGQAYNDYSNEYAGDVVIPATASDGTKTYAVTSISDRAFNLCYNLTSVTFPGSLTSIGFQAFWGCNSLTSVTIPNSVTSIGNSAFLECSSLTSVTIGNSVASIGINAFWDCSSLTSINVDADNPNYMSENGVLFDKTKTTIVQYPIGKSVVTYTIPESVSSIGYGAFRRCSSLTSIIIPNSVALIDKYAFAYCSGLTSAVIPNGVTVINDYAFYDCSSLASVIIPKSVTSIRGLAFYGCSRLTSITSLANTPPSVVPLQPFYNVNASITVYVPCGSRVAYQSAGQWNNFTNYNEIFTFTIEVQSNNNTMGMATVTQQPTTCINNQATIEATANSGYRFAQWNDGNTDNPRTITVTSDIVLTAGFEMNTGITDIQTSSFSIYPNPAKNNVTIELSEYTVGTLAVFDLNGKIVVCQSINGTYATINTSSFANGNYIVRLVNDGKPSEGVRFVKQ